MFLNQKNMVSVAYIIFFHFNEQFGLGDLIRIEQGHFKVLFSILGGIKMYKKYSIAAGAALAVGLAGMVAPAVAKVEGDTIVIGSSLSLTGKYLSLIHI